MIDKPDALSDGQGVNPSTPTNRSLTSILNGGAVAWRWRFEDETSWTLTKTQPQQFSDTIIQALYPHPPADLGAKAALNAAIHLINALRLGSVPKDVLDQYEQKFADELDALRSSAGQSDNKLKAFADDCRRAAREYDDMAGKGRRISAETVAAAYRRIARELDALHIPVGSADAAATDPYDDPALTFYPPPPADKIDDAACPRCGRPGLKDKRHLRPLSFVPCGPRSPAVSDNGGER